MPLINGEKMRDFGIRLLCAYGASRENAELITKHLIDNDYKGVEAHGAMRFYEYVNFMATGSVDGTACSHITEQAEGVFLVEGNRGFGIVAMETAVSAMLHALKTRTMALAGVRGVGHTGRIGAYAEKFAAQECMGMIFGGGGHKKYKTVAPFGGRKGVMSTNPLAFALPGLPEAPLTADFATSASAGGKLRLAQRKGVSLPPGQILDKEGRPSVDPADFFNGGVMLPSAGAKGSGLGMINELLCYGLLGDPLEFNWILVAFRLDALGSPEDYRRRSTEFLKLVNAIPPAEGFAAVCYPGQLEARQEAINREKGITVDKAIASLLEKAASAKQVAVPAELL